MAPRKSGGRTQVGQAEANITLQADVPLNIIAPEEPVSIPVQGEAAAGATAGGRAGAAGGPIDVKALTTAFSAAIKAALKEEFVLKINKANLRGQIESALEDVFTIKVNVATDAQITSEARQEGAPTRVTQGPAAQVLRAAATPAPARNEPEPVPQWSKELVTYIKQGQKVSNINTAYGMLAREAMPGRLPAPREGVPGAEAPAEALKNLTRVFDAFGSDIKKWTDVVDTMAGRGEIAPEETTKAKDLLKGIRDSILGTVVPGDVRPNAPLFQERFAEERGAAPRPAPTEERAAPAAAPPTPAPAGAVPAAVAGLVVKPKTAVDEPLAEARAQLRAQEEAEAASTPAEERAPRKMGRTDALDYYERLMAEGAPKELEAAPPRPMGAMGRLIASRRARGDATRVLKTRDMLQARVDRNLEERLAAGKGPWSDEQQEYIDTVLGSLEMQAIELETFAEGEQAGLAVPKRGRGPRVGPRQRARTGQLVEGAAVAGSGQPINPQLRAKEFRSVPVQVQMSLEERNRRRERAGLPPLTAQTFETELPAYEDFMQDQSPFQAERFQGAGKGFRAGTPGMEYQGVRFDDLTRALTGGYLNFVGETTRKGPSGERMLVSARSRAQEREFEQIGFNRTGEVGGQRVKRIYPQRMLRLLMEERLRRKGFNPTEDPKAAEYLDQFFASELPRYMSSSGGPSTARAATPRAPDNFAANRPTETGGGRIAAALADEERTRLARRRMSLMEGRIAELGAEAEAMTISPGGMNRLGRLLGKRSKLIEAGYTTPEGAKEAHAAAGARSRAAIAGVDPEASIQWATKRQKYVDAIAAAQRGETPTDPDTGQPMVALTKEHALRSLRRRMNALGEEPTPTRAPGAGAGKTSTADMRAKVKELATEYDRQQVVLKVKDFVDETFGFMGKKLVDEFNTQFSKEDALPAGQFIGLKRSQIQHAARQLFGRQYKMAEGYINEALGQAYEQIGGHPDPADNVPALRRGAAAGAFGRRMRRYRRTTVESDAQRRDATRARAVDEATGTNITPGGQYIGDIRRGRQGVGGGTTELDLERQLLAGRFATRGAELEKGRAAIKAQAINKFATVAGYPGYTFDPLAGALLSPGKTGKGGYPAGSVKVSEDEFINALRRVSPDLVKAFKREAGGVGPARREISSRESELDDIRRQIRVNERVTRTTRSLAAGFMAGGARAPYEGPVPSGAESLGTYQGPGYAPGRPMAENLRDLALFATERGIGHTTPEYLDLQSRVISLINVRSKARPERLPATGAQTVEKAAANLPGAAITAATQPKGVREEVREGTAAYFRPEGAAGGAGGNGRGTTTGGETGDGRPQEPPSTATIIPVWVKNPVLSVALHGTGAPAMYGTRGEQAAAARSGADLNYSIGAANIKKFTTKSARAFVESNAGRLRGEGMSDEQILRMFSGIDERIGAVFAGTMPDKEVGGGGLGGAAGAANRNARRERLGLSALTARTEEYYGEVDKADKKGAELMARARRAERGIPKRAFGPSVTDIFANLGGYLDEQVAAVARFQREGTELRTHLAKRAPTYEAFTRAEEEYTAATAQRDELIAKRDQAKASKASGTEIRELNKAIRQNAVDVTNTKRLYDEASRKLEEYNTQEKFQVQRVEEAETALPTPGKRALAFGIGFAASSAAIAVGMITAQLAQVGMQIVATAAAPIADRLSGFSATVGRTQEALAKQTAASYDNVAATLASAASQSRLSQAALDAIEGPLGDRTRIVAGTQQLAARTDLVRTGFAAQNQMIGGYDRALTRPTGGVVDWWAPNTPLGVLESLSIGGQPSFAETFAGRIRDLPIPEGQSATSNNAISQWVAGLFGGFEDGLEEATKQLNVLNKEYEKTGVTFARVNDQGALEAQAEALRQAGAQNLGQELLRRQVLISDQGVGVGNRDQALAALDAMSRVPVDLELLMRNAERTFTAVEAGRIRMLNQQRDILIPAQLGVSRAMAPMGDVTAPLRAMGVTDLGQLEQDLAGVNAQAEKSAEFAKTYVAGMFKNEPEVGRQFAAAFDQAAGYAKEIADLQIGVQTAQAEYSAHQYAYSLKIAERSLANAKELATGIAQAHSNGLGLIERQTWELNRQSQALSLGMSQRQINFQKSIAGFKVAGLSPEEQAARYKQAKLEADYAQKQLDIQKKLFGLAGKGFEITADQNVIDLGKQIGLLQEGREVQLKTAKAEAQIALVNKKLEEPRALMETYFKTAVEKTVWLEGQITEFAAATGEAMADVATKVLESFAVAYQGMMDVVSGYTQRGAQYVTPEGDVGHRTAGKYGFNFDGSPDNDGNKTNSLASGGLFNTSGTANLTVGEADTETVAVLRNPRPMLMGGGAGGGQVFNFNITIEGGGDSVTDEKLVKWSKQLVREIDRSLGRTGSLIGMRDPAFYHE